MNLRSFFLRVNEAENILPPCYIPFYVFEDEFEYIENFQVFLLSKVGGSI